MEKIVPIIILLTSLAACGKKRHENTQKLIQSTAIPNADAIAARIGIPNPNTASNPIIPLSALKHGQQNTVLFSSNAGTQLPVGDADHSAKAFVVGSEVLAYRGDIADAEKANVNSSILYAQFAANQKFDVHQHADQWNAEYRKYLTALGWKIESTGQVNSQTMEAASALELSKALVGVLKEFGLSEHMSLVGIAIKALESLADQVNIQFFGKTVTNSKHTMTRVGLVEKSGENFSLGQVSVEVDATLTANSIFFFTSKTHSVTVSSRKTNLLFDNAFYVQHAEAVRAKLADNSKAFTIALVR